jgi:hypothetical protein
LGEGQEGNPTSGAGAGYRELLRGTGLYLSSVMFRKPVLQELGGFNPLLTLGKDLEFVHRIASEEPVVFLRSILNEYRRHSNRRWSESSTSQAQRLIVEQHLLEAESHGRSGDAKAGRIGLANLTSGRSVFALELARKAQQRHDCAGSVLPLFQALIASPRGTLRALGRAMRRDVLHNVRGVEVALDRIRPDWFGRAEDAKSASRTPQSEDDA